MSEKLTLTTALVKATNEIARFQMKVDSMNAGEKAIARQSALDILDTCRREIEESADTHAEASNFNQQQKARAKGQEKRTKIDKV